MRKELRSRGFRNLALWPRGVDTRLFHPDQPCVLDLPRPIFLTVAVWLREEPRGLPRPRPSGSKVVVGDGPAGEELKFRYPKAHFLGLKQGAALAAIYASADAFVFPSLTDTFDIVMLEAAASGLPTAAFPVPGPLDVLGGTGAAALDQDLRKACLAALRLSSSAAATSPATLLAAATDAFTDHVIRRRAAEALARLDGEWYWIVLA